MRSSTAEPILKKLSVIFSMQRPSSYHTQPPTTCKVMENHSEAVVPNKALLRVIKYYHHSPPLSFRYFLYIYCSGPVSLLLIYIYMYVCMYICMYLHQLCMTTVCMTSVCMTSVCMYDYFYNILIY